ncbi:hypothetical protein CDN99_05860 [Roseateles aquatilis]|uniref:DUF2946 domain-containing protein n=1 Tax=Roseateles aquatilis TaxID=431061 RepID=A0A246JHA3_9BURK|nr:hypothetical protein [Roseateles aquatilis]OWQ91893.1 hypothetical protein CDN99_05860 [Roseateles aquatilis]
MRHRLLHRLSTTLLVVLSLLFSQLALANYVCPQDDGEAMTAAMDAGMPCDGMDQDQPALCHQHAADPGKTFEAAKLPVVSLPMVVHELELPQALDAQVAPVTPDTATAQGQPPPAPLFLSTLRLRV